MIRIKRYKKRAKRYAKTSKSGKIAKRFAIDFIPGTTAEKRFVKSLRKRFGLKDE
jgi:hypothetical protein